MHNQTSNRSWLTQLRRVFPTFWRARRFAQLTENRQPNQKLTPIAKVLADAGRSTSHAD
jgi:hypothetical protein